MTNQTNTVDRIIAQMKDLSGKHKLPEIFQEDLEIDFTILKHYEGATFIWLLRSCGSLMIPTRVGADPTYVTHWLWGDSGGQVIVPFKIDSTTGIVEKITFEQAEKLIMQLPCQLTTSASQDALINSVSAVLEFGCENKIWGIFDSPRSVSSVGGWPEWQAYFSTTGNRLMADFMGKAIRYANIRKAA